jgi:hypothetical protein
VDSQQANSSLACVEEPGSNINANKVVAVAGKMFFSIFANSEKYLRFLLSEKNKLFFEVDFIKVLLVFAELVWGKGWGHSEWFLVFY